MVELMAVYSPPMPAPVRKRNSAKLHKIPGQRGRRGGDEIDRERDEEQLLAPEPVGQPAEEQRAEHRAGQIGAAGEPDVGVGELQRRALLQSAGEIAPAERHLEAVEDPGDAERDDDERVEPAPGQPVEPRRDVGLDDRRRRGAQMPGLRPVPSMPSSSHRACCTRAPTQGNDLSDAGVPRRIAPCPRPLPSAAANPYIEAGQS